MQLTEPQRHYLGAICNRCNHGGVYRTKEAHATVLRGLVEKGLVVVEKGLVKPTQHGQYTIAQYRH